MLIGDVSNDYPQYMGFIEKKKKILLHAVWSAPAGIFLGLIWGRISVPSQILKVGKTGVY